MLEIKYTFANKELQKLAQKSPVLKKELNAAISDSAFLIENKAKHRIQRGPKTGRLYKRGKKYHRASAPGESPATDKGFLVRSIHTNRNSKALSAEIGSNLKYAPYSERGTIKMKPRPWLEPSLRESVPQIEKLISKAIERAFK